MVNANYDLLLWEILDENQVCSYHELGDRVYRKLSLKGDGSLSYKHLGRWLRSNLKNKSLNYEPKPVGYGRSVSFYFRKSIDEKIKNKVIHEKTRLIEEHRKRTELIGEFGQDLVASVLHRSGCTNVETNKKKHNGLGNNRKEIDVFAIHSDGYYLGVEVKNRSTSSWLKEDQAKNDIETMKNASDRWDIRIRPAFVVSFSYPNTNLMLGRLGIPILVTSRQYVPSDYSDFYLKYKKQLGAWYVTPTRIDNPPKELKENIKYYIIDWRKNGDI